MRIIVLNMYGYRMKGCIPLLLSRLSVSGEKRKQKWQQIYVKSHSGDLNCRSLPGQCNYACMQLIEVYDIFLRRVDICARSADAAEINEPCAVMEMTVGEQGSLPRVLRFFQVSGMCVCVFFPLSRIHAGSRLTRTPWRT
jgi:hypothetical protein